MAADMPHVAVSLCGLWHQLLTLMLNARMLHMEETDWKGAGSEQGASSLV